MCAHAQISVSMAVAWPHTEVLGKFVEVLSRRIIIVDHVWQEKPKPKMCSERLSVVLLDQDENSN